MNYQSYISVFFLLWLSFFTSSSCHAQPNKNNGKQAEPGLVEVAEYNDHHDNNKYYTILLRKTESVIKSKYFSSIRSKDIKSQYGKWENKRTVFTYSSGLNDQQPASFQIINGDVSNKTFASDGMDALVVIPPSDKITVYNLSDPIIKFKLNGIEAKRSFALRNDEQDREDFVDWARKEKVTVFQTSLLVYKDKILPQKAGVPGKSIRRFLINGTLQTGEEVFLIIQPSSPFANWEGVKKTYELVKQVYTSKFFINYMISLTATSSNNAFRVNKPDGSVYNEFKSTSDISSINDLIVFYSDAKPNTVPAVDTDVTASPNVKPTVDINDLQSLIMEYSRLDDESGDLEGIDTAVPANKNKLESNRNALQRLKRDLTNLIQNSNGSRTLNFNGISYSIYIAGLDKTEINLYLKDPNSDKYFTTIGNVRHKLEDDGMKPLMITNGGMFTPSHDPQGLYVDKNSDYKYPLDTREGMPGNFYLKPNGVFYIDQNNKPQIRVTEEVQALIDAKSFNPKIATQSGPMLVINNKVHPQFTKGSANLNIRNGVGVFSDSKIIFAISDAPTNFYDFASFFRNILNCKNALYLDGAISKMYLSDSNGNFTDGSFGPMISVTPKK